MLYPCRTGADLVPLGVDAGSLQALRSVLQASSGVVMVGCREPVVRSTLLHAFIQSFQQGMVWALETLPIYRRPTISQTFVESSDQVAAYVSAAAGTGMDVIVVDDVSRSDALVAAHEAGRTRMVLAGHPEDDVVGLLGEALEAAGSALVASTLQGILAARAVRLLCPACKRVLPQGAGPEGGRRTFAAHGCDACNFTGFRGQRLLTAVWIVDSGIRHLLRSSPSQAAFERVMQAVGATVRAQGLALVEDGLISLDELSRVARAD